jgi:integrase
MRQGELLGLDWRDIDFEKRRVHIRRSVVQVGGDFYEGDVKTESSQRWITIPALAIEALHTHRQRMKQEGRDTAEGRVFVTQGGRSPQRSNLLNETLLPALEAAGLPRITWRELRHTFASASIERGVPLEALSRMLGHRDPSITLQVYNKAFRGRETIVADAWDRPQKRAR